MLMSFPKTVKVVSPANVILVLATNVVFVPVANKGSTAVVLSVRASVVSLVISGKNSWAVLMDETINKARRSVSVDNIMEC